MHSNIEESAAQLKRLEEEFKRKDNEMIQLRARDMEKDRERNTLWETISEKQKEVEKLRESIKTHVEESAAKLKNLEEELLTKDDEITKLNQKDLAKDNETGRLLQNINKKHKNRNRHRNRKEKLENSIQANTEEAAVQLIHLEKELNAKLETYKRKNAMMEEEMENIKKQHEETERCSDELRQQMREELEQNKK